MATEDPKVRWEEVRRLRKSKHISQQELAVEVEVSLAQISRIENGKVDRPRFKTLRSLARALDVELEDLLDSDEDGINGS